CAFLEDHGVAEALYLADDYVLTEPSSHVVPMWKSDWDSYFGVRNRLWEPGIEWLVTAMNATNKWVGLRPEALSYELHRPLPLRTEQAVKLLANFLDRPADEAPLWRTLYGVLAGFPEPVRQAQDVRVKPSGQFPQGSSWMS